jgi:hypothetical protein
MTRKKLIETAEVMEVDVRTAMTLRVKYLAEQRDKLMEGIEKLEDDILFDESLNDVTRAFLEHRLVNERMDLSKINREIKSYTQLPREGEVTDDMIATARDYPVENIIEFKGGRCKAFCHDSDSFSVAKARTGNYIFCHVCGKTFDSIQILIERDGYSFIDAVKQLN